MVGTREKKRTEVCAHDSTLLEIQELNQTFLNFIMILSSANRENTLAN